MKESAKEKLSLVELQTKLRESFESKMQRLGWGGCSLMVSPHGDSIGTFRISASARPNEDMRIKCGNLYIRNSTQCGNFSELEKAVDDIVNAVKAIVNVPVKTKKSDAKSLEPNK